MVYVELAHPVVALMRVERRCGGVDNAVPEIGLVLESLLHGIPVIMQEVKQGLVAGRAAGQHAEDQLDVRIREVLVLIQHGYLQQPEMRSIGIDIVADMETKRYFFIYY